MKQEYTKFKKIIDDYFRLVRRLMTGQGTVPEHVLRRLKLEGRKLEGLIPKMAQYGASRFSGGDPKQTAINLKQQIEAAQIRVDLALDTLQTKTLQTVQDTLATSAGIGAGAALGMLIAQAIRNRRQELRNDWTRTAKTQMHNAADSGASAAVSAYPNGDATLVYKSCQPDACDRCVAAYQNPDGTPKIFTIGELRANGSNAGRNIADWKPVIGCMHPHCKCSLQTVN